MSDAEPLERCACVGQDRIDTHAQFVGPFFRFASEIDGDDPEFAILRRYRAYQPDFAAGGRHRGAGGGFTVARCNLDDLAEHLLGYEHTGATPAAVRCFARAWKKHDVALHDAGEMVLDSGVNVGDVEGDRQASRKSVEIPEVYFALPRHLQLALEPRSELAYGDGDEDEEDEVDDFLRILDAEAVEGRIGKKRRGKHAANRGNNGRHDSPPGCRDDHRDQVDHGPVGKPDFPDQGEQHRGNGRDQAKRHENAVQFLPDRVEFQRVMHRFAGGDRVDRRVQYTPRDPSLSCRAWLESALSGYDQGRNCPTWCWECEFSEIKSTVVRMPSESHNSL